MTMELPIIQLEPWEYDWVALVAARRASARVGSADMGYYDNGRKEDERTASFASAAAECAVAKYTNRYWTAGFWDARDHSQYRLLPDVGENIEVRRVRSSFPAIRKRDTGRGLVLFAAEPIPPEFRKVKILGYLLADEAWDLGAPAHYDKSGETRLVDPKHLKLIEVKRAA